MGMKTKYIKDTAKFREIAISLTIKALFFLFKSLASVIGLSDGTFDA